MSARDDYPFTFVGGRNDNAGIYEAMCDEIDRLRAEVSKLLAKLATTDATWP